MTREDGIAGLMELGFTELEARVYAALLQGDATTGYKIAQSVGKPVANTYKAIESLQKKGAVIVEDGENRLCRAVPAEELLDRMERSFAERKQKTAEALAELQSHFSDERIYHLHSADQVLERCRKMLSRAEEIALVDAFPKPLEMLRPDLEAAGKHCKVAAKIYQPARLRHVLTVLQAQGHLTIKRWPGQWINLVVDGTEHLIALLSNDANAVQQAIWSESAYLSWVFHTGLSAEIIMTAVGALIEKKATAEEIRKAYAKYRPLVALQAPGYQLLVKRFGSIASRRRKP